MSIQKTENQLVTLLADPANKVIALSGKWGTGKSYLWNQVKAKSEDGNVKKALYVSLFGLASIDQMKVKIVQSTIPQASGGAWWDGLQTSWKGIAKVLGGFHSSFNGLSDLALLAVPMILKDRVVVLDDIERKQASLSTDAIMGFIDEYTQQHGVRVVVILNTDQLKDKSGWETLREKVIDEGITLNTTTDEAYEIASRIVPPIYSQRLKETLKICRTTNIRVVCKIIKALNNVLRGHPNLPDDVLARVIPSTVLLTAIHYKGMEDGPDLDFVLSVGEPDWEAFETPAEHLDEVGKQRAKWRLQLHELGILACDEYELIVVEYLRSGLFETADLTAIIDRYAREHETMRTKQMAHKFTQRVIWHHRVSDEELKAEAEALVNRCHHLGASEITQLIETMKNIAGADEIQKSLLEQWLAHFDANCEVALESDFFGRNLHPQIHERIKTAKSQRKLKLTLYLACEEIANMSGWGRRHLDILAAASVEDFVTTIENLEPDQLQLFMPQCLQMHLNRQDQIPAFEIASDRFVTACRRIYSDPMSARLGKLILMLFRDAKIEADLIPPPTPPSPEDD